MYITPCCSHASVQAIHSWTSRRSRYDHFSPATACTLLSHCLSQTRRKALGLLLRAGHHLTKRSMISKFSPAYCTCIVLQTLHKKVTVTNTTSLYGSSSTLRIEKYSSTVVIVAPHTDQTEHESGLDVSTSRHRHAAIVFYVARKYCGGNTLGISR